MLSKSLLLNGTERGCSEKQLVCPLLCPRLERVRENEHAKRKKPSTVKTNYMLREGDICSVMLVSVFVHLCGQHNQNKR